jgi:hypothetical protein
MYLTTAKEGQLQPNTKKNNGTITNNKNKNKMIIIVIINYKKNYYTILKECIK